MVYVGTKSSPVWREELTGEREAISGVTLPRSLCLLRHLDPPDLPTLTCTCSALWNSRASTVVRAKVQEQGCLGDSEHISMKATMSAQP